MSEVQSDYDILHQAVFDAVALALGLNEAEANDMLRYTTPIGESQPFEDLVPDDNECYIRLASATLGGVGGRDRIYRDIAEDVGAGIAAGFAKDIHVLDGVTAFLVFYGPDAMTNAAKALVWLHEDAVKERLEQDGLAVVSDVIMPVWMPELVNGQWLNRCDLEVRMYRKVEHTTGTAGIAGAWAMEESPVIIIKRSV